MLEPQRVIEIQKAFHKYVNKDLDSAKDYLHALVEDDSVHLPEFYECWKDEMDHVNEAAEVCAMVNDLIEDWFKCQIDMADMERRLSRLTK